MLKKSSRIQKSEARNPKFETNSNNRSTKLKTGRRRGWKIWSFGFRIPACRQAGVSDFDIRISNSPNHIKHLANSRQKQKLLKIIP